MSDLAVRAEGLAKRYLIGTAPPWYRSLREALVEAAASVLRPSTRTEQEDQSRELWALEDVSFEIKQGEVLGIIGRNGAGKSTLLKLLSRITEPTRGRAEVYGRVGSLLEVGTGFHPELSGRENIYLNGAILGMSRADIQAKFDEMVAFAELERFLDTPVKRYSSGMYMRLAFSVAAHLEPDVLVVDEVLAVGDAEFQKKCLGKMEDISREGRTVVFVSHNMPAVNRLCSRAILLKSGSIVMDASASDTVSAYLAGAAGNQETRTWDNLATAPGTPQLKLLSVSVTEERGIPVAMASVEDELRIRIGYYVGEPGLRFRCCVVLSTQGTSAFSTMEPFEHVRERRGRYYSYVTIPRHLLAEAEYSVKVSVFASRGVKHHFISAEDVVAFQVYDPMTGQSARGDYAEGFAGVLRPRLEWTTSYLGEERDATPAAAATNAAH